MTHLKQIKRLEDIAAVVLDQNLMALKAAMRLQSETRAKLEALDRCDGGFDCAPQAAARADVLYQIWVEARRSELNLKLAQHSAAVILAKDAARAAFGKTSALQGLTARLR
jgi:hypothetical protein